MGNWRTVNIAGTISGRDAARLREHLGYTYEPDDPGWKRFGPLSFSKDKPSLCGVGAWPAETVNAQGNLAERGYSVDDVAGELRKLVVLAPTMLLKVHCGGDYEGTRCVATISVGEGLVVVGKPEVADVAPPGEDQMVANLLANIAR